MSMSWGKRTPFEVQTTAGKRLKGNVSDTFAAIAMGKSGAGKTTFYNKLCGTSHAATYSLKSVTRQLFRSDVIHGGNRFSLSDTPGTDSRDEVYKHSFLLKEALTNGPVNAIFALVQFNDRCVAALDELDKTISYLKEEYHDMVVVVISKIDLAPQANLDVIKADYRKEFTDEGFPRLMFISSQMTATSVAAEMWCFMRAMPKRQLQYEETDFVKYFRFAEESSSQKKQTKKHEHEIRLIFASYKRILGELGSMDDKDDVIMCAIAASRYEVDRIYDQFIAEYGDRMVDMDCYTNSIRLQKTIDAAHREFREDVKQMMSYNPDDTKDWRNCIRKCQHCGEIWVKVSGCEGATTCGNRESSKDVGSRPWFQYDFPVSGGVRTWRRNEAVAATPATTSPAAAKADKARGCGQTIVWSNQPRLDRDELDKCLSVKGIEEVISTMQKKPEFDMVVKKYEQKIDASFTK